MTAPSAGQPSAEAVEAVKVAAERYMTGGQYDDAMELAALSALAAAWPLLRAQVIAECAAWLEVDEDLDPMEAHRAAHSLRALLPPSGGPPKEGETNG